MYTPNLYDDVLFVLVQVGHNALLPRRRKFNAPEDLAIELVSGMEFQRRIRHDLSRAFTECASLHQQIAGYHLDRPAGATGIWNLHTRKARVIPDHRRGLTDGQ